MADSNKTNSNPTHEKIRLYLGYAPGKTTALNGLLLRALGAGLKVKIILFSKCPENTSESKIYDLLKLHFQEKFDYFFAGISRIRPNGSFRFYGDKDGYLKEDEEKLIQGISMLSTDLTSGKYDLLCIDELTDLLYYKVKGINEENIKLLFQSIHPSTAVIITGHKCPDWLLEFSSTTIEGKVIKHYQGITKGIEW